MPRVIKRKRHSDGSVVYQQDGEPTAFTVDRVMVRIGPNNTRLHVYSEGTYAGCLIVSSEVCNDILARLLSCSLLDLENATLLPD